jgi:hypothetical protein
MIQQGFGKYIDGMGRVRGLRDAHYDLSKRFYLLLPLRLSTSSVHNKFGPVLFGERLPDQSNVRSTGRRIQRYNSMCCH